MSDHHTMYSSETDVPKNASRKLKGRKLKGKPRQKFRLADVRVGTTLLWMLALFMVLLVALGGLGGYFLWQNMDTIRALEKQDHRSQLASRIGSDMMAARVSLLSAARYEQEAVATADMTQRERGRESIATAKDKLETVRAAFAEFRKTMGDMGVERREATRIVGAYQPYLDDAVDPMLPPQSQ